MSRFIEQLEGRTLFSTYFSDYGANRSHEVVISAPGRHSLEVDRMPAQRYTEWYSGGQWIRTDDSGSTGVDPRLQMNFPTGTTGVEAVVFDRNWNVLQRHVWHVRAAGQWKPLMNRPLEVSDKGEFKRVDYIKVDGKLKTHLGVDYRADAGERVFAVAAGRVVNRIDDKEGNWVIAIHHKSTGGDFIGIYGHIQSPLQIGNDVEAGDEVGRVGKRVGTHLHFGVRPGATFNQSDYYVQSKPPIDGVVYEAGWGRMDSVFYRRNGIVNDLRDPQAWLRTYRPLPYY